jgi:hypothetical protein
MDLLSSEKNVPLPMRLRDIAHARSGDKGNHANVGVIAYTETGFEFLGKFLTETRMAEFLLPLRPKQVERYPLPGIRAYNFVLHDILAGGASRSLRTDSQGKVLALAILEMPLPERIDTRLMVRSAT